MLEILLLDQCCCSYWRCWCWKGALYWKNGSVAYAITAEKPDAIRGHEFDFIWIDELASFRYAEEVMNQLKLANGRINPPKAIITTTPKPLQISHIAG